MYCSECGLSQLSIVVDPSSLFSNYTYRSSINKGYVDHCRKMAKDLKEQYGFNKDSYHIDIAGNDGALLKEFKDEWGHHVLNIDPAENLKSIAEAQGIKTVAKFWDPIVALESVTDLKKADLITATNVFAHVDDLHSFMEGILYALDSKGAFIVEFPYIIDFLHNNEFDTIYFEHLSYLGIRPLSRLVKKFGLKIMKVEHFPIHGGSVRVHIGYGNHDGSVDKYIQRELDLSYEDYADFYKASHRAMRDLKKGLAEIKEDNKRIIAFGASAKGTTLLNSSGINFKTVPYVVDETPEKIGKFCPVSLIEVKPLDFLKYYHSDYLLILAWNFKNEIMDKCRALGYRGKFILPIPEFKIIM